MAAKRLIDANALIRNYEARRNLYIDAFGSYSKMPTIDKVTVNIINTCIADVVNAPTVDAVEVVRCKNCTHCTTIGLPRCRITGRNMTDDDFCSRGERREVK